METEPTPLLADEEQAYINSLDFYNIQIKQEKELEICDHPLKTNNKLSLKDLDIKRIEAQAEENTDKRCAS